MSEHCRLYGFRAFDCWEMRTAIEVGVCVAEDVVDGGALGVDAKPDRDPDPESDSDNDEDPACCLCSGSEVSNCSLRNEFRVSKVSIDGC